MKNQVPNYLNFPPKKWQRFGEIAVILSLLLLALGLRWYKLGELMPFTYDQGRDLLKLREISHGNLTLIGPTTGLAGIFLGPLIYYFLLPGFILYDGSPMGVGYWMAFWTTLTLPVSYLILKPLVGKWWAWLGYLALVASPG